MITFSHTHRFLIVFTLLISLKSIAAVDLFCETGDPSGRGAQAYVVSTTSSNSPIEIRWISARGKEVKYNLVLTSVKNGVDEFKNRIRISTYVATVGVKFELVQFLENEDFYQLSLITNLNTTKLACL